MAAYNTLMRIALAGGGIVLCVLGTLTYAAPPAAAAKRITAQPPGEKTPQTKSSKPRKLFDGKTLEGWKQTNFGGEGEVHVEDSMIVMEIGSPMTGITYAGKQPLPKTDYEIGLKTMRLDGFDFFCALTFPVHDAHCTFVVGGWAGAVVGISSIDGYDASQNATTRYESFDSNRWYQIRVRVRGRHLQAWIDDQKMVDFDATKHELSTRMEVDLCKPLGIASYITRAGIKDIYVRALEPAAKKPVDAATDDER